MSSEPAESTSGCLSMGGKLQWTSSRSLSFAGVGAAAAAFGLRTRRRFVLHAGLEYRHQISRSVELGRGWLALGLEVGPLASLGQIRSRGEQALATQGVLNPQD